jgi:hypothetical protein
MTGLSVIAFLATCIIIWTDQTETARLRNEDSKWKSWIGGKMGSEEMTQKYVDVVRQLSQEYIRETTGTVIDRFFASDSGQREA